MTTSATTRPSANLLHSTLRLKGADNAIGPLRPARSEDALRLEEIARELSMQRLRCDQLLLTTGIGLREGQEIPVRLPALLLPGLHVLERFASLGLQPPKYLVYQATDFIALTNGYPLDEARKCGQKMETYLRRYVETFHSRIADLVQIHFLCPHCPNVQRHIEETIEVIRFEISEKAGVRDAMSQLDACEGKHSRSSGHAQCYAAANAVYSGATAAYPFEDMVGENNRVILPIGGKAEKPFFAITSALSVVAGKSVIPLLTVLGSRPTYFAYPAQGDPLSVDQYVHALASPLSDGPLRADLAALQFDGATPDALASIFPSS